MTHRLIPVLALALLCAAGCKAEQGQVCQRYPNGDSDCAAGLECCGTPQLCPGEVLARDRVRGICQPQAMCPENVDPTNCEDAGPVDASVEDAGPIETDAGPIETDAGPIETDAGPIETDAGPVDAGPVDAGPVDAGPVDAGPVDAGPFDAGP